MKSYRGRLFDHVNVKVCDIQKSKNFYRPVVEALGHAFSYEESNFFCIDEFMVSESREASQAIHLAFQAESAAAVKLFYQAALGNGGRSIGAPGESNIHSGQYSAYVLDPDGNNIEAVYHGPLLRSAAYIVVNLFRWPLRHV
jgi:predicted lactoylglutathione lyase